MALTLTRTSDAATEPVSLTDAKDHLRVDTSADDSYINALIAAARQYVEEITRRALITQTWEFSLDDFPLSKLVDMPWSEYLEFRNRAILLPRPPLQSVTKIEYVDTDGATQTLAASVYRVDTKSEPARLTEAEGETWPTTDHVTNAVTITYVAGYSPDDSSSPTDEAANVPQPIKHAMKLLIGHWYENREQVNVGNIVTPMPSAAHALLAPYRVMI